MPLSEAQDLLLRMLDPSMSPEEIEALYGEVEELESQGNEGNPWVLSEQDVVEAIESSEWRDFYNLDDLRWVSQISSEFQEYVGLRVWLFCNPSTSRSQMSDWIWLMLDASDRLTYSSYLWFYVYLLTHPLATPGPAQNSGFLYDCTRTMGVLMAAMVARFYARTQDKEATWNVVLQWMKSSDSKHLEFLGWDLEKRRPSKIGECDYDCSMNTWEWNSEPTFEEITTALRCGFLNLGCDSSDEDGVNFMYGFIKWCIKVIYLVLPSGAELAEEAGVELTAKWYVKILPQAERLREMTGTLPAWRPPLERLL